MEKKLLTILTNAAHLTLTDGEEYPSGFWAEEFAMPYEMFKKAGYAVDLATLGGVPPTVDKSSLDPEFMKWVRPSFSRSSTMQPPRQSTGGRSKRLQACALRKMSPS